MKPTVLIMGAALATLAAGAAWAPSARAADRFAEPGQPVPYSELNTYLKDLPHQRMGLLARGENAAIGANVNASATTSAPAAAPQASDDSSAATKATVPTPANPSAVGSTPTEPTYGPGAPLSKASPAP